MSASNEHIQFALISNFNLQNLGAMLAKDGGSPQIKPVLAPFGHVTQALVNPEMEIWRGGVSGALVWTTPESVSSAFARLVNHEAVGPEQILEDVDAFCDAVRQVPRSVKHVFIPSWTLPADRWRLGILDMHSAFGASLAIMRMNLRLAEQMSGDLRMIVLDATSWVSHCGEAAFSSRLWYMSKTPFSGELFKVAVREVKAALRALAGQNKKLVILDMDDTLWGGVVGDVGWQNVRLGGHDAIGEAYRDFQVSLKRLKQRGILLALVSKNEEATALEALRNNPEMVLRTSDFAGWRINWQDKAQNIVDLVAELNLGLQSVVFLDDNPVERQRVRDALPEVLVPEWPRSPLDFCGELSRLTCLDPAQISDEDQRRGQMYISERQRLQTRHKVSSVEDWLNTLEMSVEVHYLTPATLERVTQLLNKTNQMNLTTRRVTKEELSSWADDARNLIMTYRVADRFGDYGLVGVGSIRLAAARSPVAELVDFVLSCRVMGRGVEEVMIHTLNRAAKDAGAARMTARHVPTPKNAPCLAFLQRSGLQKGDIEAEFTWETQNDYDYPKALIVKYASPK